MITVLADENIAGLEVYFAKHDNVKLIQAVGRQISAKIDEYRPDALFIRSVTPINQSTLGDTVKFVGTATLGIDHVDTDFLHKQNIAFASAAGSSKHSVAQYVLTAILHLRPDSIHQSIKLGIVGLGNIGKALAEYAEGLGWQVVGFDPFLPKDKWNNSDFETLLATSDVISIHTPLTQTGTHPTRHLFDDGAFAKMGHNTMLINSARGQVVCETALMADVARTGRQVVLDVFPCEPTVSDTLLFHVKLATPHIAGYTIEGKLRGTDMVYRAFCRAFGLVEQVSLVDILPHNPYHWQELVDALRARDGSALQAYYDIVADDSALRAVNVGGVPANAFDNLRKTYRLRHEWQP